MATVDLSKFCKKLMVSFDEVGLEALEKVRSNAGKDRARDFVRDTRQYMEAWVKQDAKDDTHILERAMSEKPIAKTVLDELKSIKRFSFTIESHSGPNFADGSSTSDSMSETICMWLNGNNAKEHTCRVEVAYEVSCAGHSGGVEDIEEISVSIQHDSDSNPAADEKKQKQDDHSYCWSRECILRLCDEIIHEASELCDFFDSPRVSLLRMMYDDRRPLEIKEN